MKTSQLPEEYNKLIPIYIDSISNFVSSFILNPKLDINIIKERFRYKIKISISDVDESIFEDEKLLDEMSDLIYKINLNNIDEDVLNYINLHENLYEIYSDYEDDHLILYIIFPRIAKSLTKDNLDDLIKKWNWDMEPLDRSIDSLKYETYKTNIDDPKVKFVSDFIIKNTIYVDYQTFKKELLNLVDKLPEKFNICFLNELTYPGKVGSEHWIVLILWSYIRDNVIEIISNINDINNAYPIVYFDDAIYSGQNIINDVDYINSFYNRKFYNNTYTNILYVGLSKQIISNKYLTNEIILAVPYVSNIGLYRINEYKKKTNINIKVIYNKLTSAIVILLKMIKSDIYNFTDELELVDLMRDNFNAMDLNIALYFDHKIAGNSSSFPDLYEKIIKRPISRSKINMLNDILEKYFR